MLRLGIIGTNWITHAFVEAALSSKAYQLTAIYSRNKVSARDFANHYENAFDMILSTNLLEFCQLKEVDVIYIASPNSLHFEQAKCAIKEGKHVIIEKPAVSNFFEFEELIQLAKEKEVFCFEAARHIHEENFKRVTKMVQNRTDILGADLTFMKYSSRYDAVLNGEIPNIFSTEFSGGALMDLGVYLVYAAISWFGMPHRTHYFYQKLPTGVDGLGTLIFRYKGFDVTMLVGKNADSYLPSEIYFSNETISLDAISSIKKITTKKRDKKDQVIEADSDANVQDMLGEAVAFSQVINNPQSLVQQRNYDKWTRLSLAVHQTLTAIRKEAGIVFLADTKKGENNDD